MILWAALIVMLATLVAISAKVRVGRPKPIKPNDRLGRVVKPHRSRKRWDGS